MMAWISCLSGRQAASGRSPTNLEARRFSADSGKGISSGYPRSHFLADAWSLE